MAKERVERRIRMGMDLDGALSTDGSDLAVAAAVDGGAAIISAPRLPHLVDGVCAVLEDDV